MRDYDIKPIKGKGFGLIANCDIPSGTRIIDEAALLTIGIYRNVDHAMATGWGSIPEIVRNMPPYKIAAYHSLHTAHPWDGSNDKKVMVIFMTNAIPLVDANLEVMGTGIFLDAGRINHACRPNTQLVWNPDRERLTAHTSKDIKEGEEITISYFEDTMPRSLDYFLEKAFGFVCNCEVCTLPAEQIAKFDKLIADMEVIKRKIADDKEGENSVPSKTVIHDMRQLMALYHRRGIPDVWLTKFYFSFATVLHAAGSRRKAKMLAGWARDNAKTLMGDDHPTTIKLNAYIEQVKDELAVGMVDKHEVENGDPVVQNLDDNDFGEWMLVE